MQTGDLDKAACRFAARRPLLVKLSPFGVGFGLKLYRGVRSPEGSLWLWHRAGSLRSGEPSLERLRLGGGQHDQT
jgi:hypothetical protein